jgi:hypothetical protein
MKREIVKIKGVDHMVVTPVKSLFHSSMVHDVIVRGRKFVVNLETNGLTIYLPPSQVTKNTAILTRVRKYFSAFSKIKHAWADSVSTWESAEKPYLWTVVEVDGDITVLQDSWYGWLCALEGSTVIGAVNTHVINTKKVVIMDTSYFGLDKYVWR